MLIVFPIVTHKSLLRTKPRPVCSRNNKVLRNDRFRKGKIKRVVEINVKRKIKIAVDWCSSLRLQLDSTESTVVKRTRNTIWMENSRTARCDVLVKRVYGVSVSAYFTQIYFTTAGHSLNMGRKAFIDRNIFMCKQYILGHLSLSMMIKGSVSCLKILRKSQHRVIFYASNEIYYIQNTIFPLYIYIYRVSHELRSLLRESVPYVEIYRYNSKHLCPKLNGYGDNGQRSLKL
jgi:hypothetical protein